MEKNNEMVNVYVKQITVIMIAFCIKLMLEIHLVIFAFTPRLHKYKKLKVPKAFGKGRYHNQLLHGAKEKRYADTNCNPCYYSSDTSNSKRAKPTFPFNVVIPVRQC